MLLLKIRTWEVSTDDQAATKYFVAGNFLPEKIWSFPIFSGFGLQLNREEELDFPAHVTIIAEMLKSLHICPRQSECPA